MSLSQAQKDALKSRKAQPVFKDMASDTIPGVPDNTPLVDVAEAAKREYEALGGDPQQLVEEYSKLAGNVSRETSQRDPLDEAGAAHADMHLRDEDVLYDDTPKDDDVVPYLMPRSNDFIVIEGVRVTEGLSEDELETLSENIFSYAGVVPRPIDGYTGRWLICLGAALMPVEHDTGESYVDESTGEVRTRILRWTAPLFKLAIIDDMTGMHVVLSGGGKYGRLFARQMTGMFGAGDWKKPKEVFISQEARKGDDGQPRRMYRFMHRRIQ